MHGPIPNARCPMPPASYHGTIFRDSDLHCGEDNQAGARWDSSSARMRRRLDTSSICRDVDALGGNLQ
jgi:hypothetical protein